MPQGKIFSVDDLSDQQVGRLFFVARQRKQLFFLEKQLSSCPLVLNVFFEPSTRTRLSFEVAALRLGFRVANFDAFSSSMIKGEDEEVTISNLLLLGPDLLIVRSKHSFFPEKLRKVDCAVINAGDGTNEHPTQALLDCFTLLEHFRSDDLYKKNILIIGDLLHSRVARSNIKLMNRLGARVFLLSPKNLGLIQDWGQKQNLHCFSQVNEKIDAVMCLRVQKERLSPDFFLCEEQFRKHFKLTAERFARFSKECLIMHPGPFNPGLEIDLEVANHPRSLIKRQVQNGVFIRASLIKFLFTKR